MRIPLGKTRLHSKFQMHRPINDPWPPIWSFTLKLQRGYQPKIWFSHNFWLEGPIDLRRTRLNCIMQDLFRDTPLDHIWGAQIRAQICQIWPNMPNMHIWVHIWARKIWSSGVSLKRSCKMQFRRVGLRSIGPSSQKLWHNQIFVGHPRIPNVIIIKITLVHHDCKNCVMLWWNLKGIIPQKIFYSLGPGGEPNSQAQVVFRPLRPKRALRHPITVWNMRFRRENFFCGTIPLLPLKSWARPVCLD